MMLRIPTKINVFYPILSCTSILSSQYRKYSKPEMNDLTIIRKLQFKLNHDFKLFIN